MRPSILRMILILGVSLSAEAQTVVEISAPEGSGAFGTEIFALPSGNIVVTDPTYSIPDGPENVGAVRLYNGSTGELISALTGSTENDWVGFPVRDQGFLVRPGVTVLSNGNFVVGSFWQDREGQRVGAVTFVNGTTGLSGVVSESNSLVGSTEHDRVGSQITALENGNYVVHSPAWNNGAIEDAGSVTFGNGMTGISGVVSASNSLVGSTDRDRVGSGRITELANGNYVVNSRFWNNGAIEDAGAVTFGNGMTGISGVVSASNSLVGSTANEGVGIVVALSNGNYTVRSPRWSTGSPEGYDLRLISADDPSGIPNEGVGLVIIAEHGPLFDLRFRIFNTAGGQVLDRFEFEFAEKKSEREDLKAALEDLWDEESLTDNQRASIIDRVISITGYTGVEEAGAVTFGDGISGVSGVISASNSLVGSSNFDSVGNVVPLANGNYVVASPSWGSGPMQAAGAVTFGDGTTGVTGEISELNSLVGSVRDSIGGGSVTPLSNGNYVVSSPDWDRGDNFNSGRGAATFGSGTTGISGTVSESNSLVGSTPGDRVSSSGITALSNGNYVVGSDEWDNGEVQNAGAATFGDGTTGITGEVSESNSLVGSTANDNVGFIMTPLPNGNYVVGSPDWDNGEIIDAGASTFGDGTTGIFGVVSSSNSLVGSTEKDQIGGTFDGFLGPVPVGLVTPLTSGNYVVSSPFWDNGGIVDAGAVTFVNGATGITGEISGSNSLVGSTENDQIGFNREGGLGRLAPTINALPNGDYAIGSPNYDNGAIIDAGAITYGDGNNGTVGPITTDNSYLGTTAGSRVGIAYVYDAVNNNFIVSRPSENIVTMVGPPFGPCAGIIGPTGLTIAFDRAANEITLRWRAEANQLYAIDGSTDLTSFSINYIEEFDPPGEEAEFTLDRPVASHTYFRVRSLCPVTP